MQLFSHDEEEPDFSDVTLPELARMVWRIDRTVNGNGRPGLAAVVGQHSTYFKVAFWLLCAVIPAGTLFIAIGQTAGWFPR